MVIRDDEVAELASRQHGLVSVAQLGRLDVSRSAIRGRVARGIWTTAGRGVLRLAGAPATWESSVLAHVLAAGEAALASHRTAAALWGLDGTDRRQLDISVPRGTWYRHDGVHTHESTDLDRTRPVRRNGIPMTSVERTLLDLGAVVGFRRVELALDDARRRRLVTWDTLLDTLVLHARRGRDGVGTLRAILDEHFGEVVVTDSGFERLVISVLRDAGLPTPVLQHEVRVAGRTYRLDLAYPDLRVAIELDGSVHLRRDVWEADHVRQNALILAGWTLLRFTWADYSTRAPLLVSEVRAALRRRP
ncbi:MAG TPA: type IV toxin-antitoxin system AbiEi family antitoxin domain-containing protein [Acidimicrobiales bacterium]|nr:type IV toxin-antitoxin system AbiEi family antitoxin domain-containing protein [Acidimicrobiales bacterium]